jgi:DNA-binding CsgD family transcriptional regulator
MIEAKEFHSCVALARYLRGRGDSRLARRERLIAKLRAEGMTQAEIALQADTTVYRVRQVLKAAGLGGRRVRE